MISVIIPAFNVERFIKDALDSVLTQTYKKMEIVVVDDGSTDDTKLILEDYARYIRTIVQKNEGVAAARNRGIAETHGEYIAFLDGDDVWFSNKLERQVNLFGMKSEVGLVSGQYECIDEVGELMGGGHSSLVCQFDRPVSLYDELLAKGNPIWTSSVIVKRQLLNEVGLFDVTKRRSQDYDMWIRLSEKNKFYVMSDKVGKYRLVRKSLTHGSIRSEYEAQLEILKKHSWRFEARDYRKRLGSFYRDWADSEFCYGTVKGALEASMQSIKSYPFNPRIYSLALQSMVKKPFRQLFQRTPRIYDE